MRLKAINNTLLQKKTNSFFRRNSYLLLAAAWLLTFAFIINNYWGVNSSPDSIRNSIQNILEAKQNNVSDFFEDTTLINTIVTEKYNESDLNRLISKDFFIYAYSKDEGGNPRSIFWNTQETDPGQTIFSGQGKSLLIRLLNGWFIKTQKNYYHDQKEYLIVCLIPVKWDYYIQNNYLQNDFVGAKGVAKNYDISQRPTALPVTDSNGKALFYLQQTGNIHGGNANPVSLSLSLLATLLILFFVHILSNHISKKYNFLKGLAFLVGSLVLFRTIFYLLNPYNFRQLVLFSPSVFEKSFVVSSLGDLFINSILFVWVILFIRYHFRFEELNFQKLSKEVRYVITALVALFMTLITFFFGNIIIGLVTDKQVSFDVINFFSLNIYSVIGFIVLSCMATGYFFLIQILKQSFRILLPDQKYLPFIFIAAIGLLQLTLTESIHINYRICLLLWLLLFVFLLDFKILLLHAYRLASSGFIFWAFFFSVSITTVIVIQNRAKELDERERFAENLADKADPSGPVIMSIILTDFKNVYLSKNFYKFRDPKQSLLLKDSLIRETFSGYQNKYNTEIYTFDADDQPLNNFRPVTYNDLNTIIQTQGKPAGVPDLYYYDVSYSNFNYISKKTITDSTGKKEGYVFIVSKPKKFKSETLYPELFSKGNSNSIESSSEYAYAIYNHGKLSTSYNDYPFSTLIKKDIFQHNGFKTIHKNGYDELWYQPQPGKIIVITKPDRFLLESITLFAYLFLSFLVITIFFNLLGHLISDRKAKNEQRPFWQLTIRSQVHGTIILISVFSFIVIGISTILFFINKSHDNNKEFLSRTIHIMENELQNALDSTSLQTLSTGSLQDIPIEKLSRIIDNVSSIHATDINLYDPDGNLKTSSLPLPYEKGILSERMDPLAWYHLNILRESQFFTEQQIGSLKYVSNYLAIRTDNGREFGYLNIPYFESQKKLQDEISNFLVAIINLNAFIFLIAGIIALFITNRITRSFSLISDKMKRINLQTGNEEIVWNRKDEIGDLVKEYNKMVKQLEVSAQKLARSEREGAWREMARQVAHEIKNPLTPMKLNLQYLQMTIDKNKGDIKEITQYVSKILLEQIDHLSQIASDFSQFANINNAKLQDFDLNEILQNVVSLYATNEKIEIISDMEEPLNIYADKTQINRLFTNLLQNAVQSVPEFRRIKIIIKSTLQDNYALVSVKDNGTGIPVSMRDKIFTPNFTTKTSGTGLGLAMCKGIVEKAGGKIWFETEEGNWTIFYVKIPASGYAVEKVQEKISI